MTPECAACGTPLEGRRPNVVYCGQACKVRAYRHRRRARPRDPALVDLEGQLRRALKVVLRAATLDADVHAVLAALAPAANEAKRAISRRRG